MKVCGVECWRAPVHLHSHIAERFIHAQRFASAKEFLQNTRVGPADGGCNRTKETRGQRNSVCRVVGREVGRQLHHASVHAFDGSWLGSLSMKNCFFVRVPRKKFEIRITAVNEALLQWPRRCPGTNSLTGYAKTGDKVWFGRTQRVQQPLWDQEVFGLSFPQSLLLFAFLHG